MAGFVPAKYRPGDNYIICDLSGQKMLMSESVKTWDGLRVHKDWWYPRHPQLDVRGIPDDMAVQDGRPRTDPVFISPVYGRGSFTLISHHGGIYYIVSVADDGAMLVTPGLLGNPVSYITIGNYNYYAADDGAILPAVSAVLGIAMWQMTSPNGTIYGFSPAPDGALIPVVVPPPA